MSVSTDQLSAYAAQHTGPGRQERPKLLMLALLCAPGLFTAVILGLDNLTQPMFGSALTTWGFAGGLLGLAGFFAGFVSILAWPGVIILSLRAVRSAWLRPVYRSLVALGCLVATYSAVFFLVWFVILPLGAVMKHARP